MDVGLLQQLVRLMSANDLNTVDLRDGDKRVMLKRGPAMMQYAPSMHMPSVHAPSPSSGAAAASAGADVVSAQTAAEESLLQIKSPMVGTYYAAPNQGEKPFASVGGTVDEAP